MQEKSVERSMTVETGQEPRTLNLCFQSLLKAYEERSAKSINRRFTELVDRSYSMPSDKWKGSFAFNHYTGIDNMAPVYLNML